MVSIGASPKERASSMATRLNLPRARFLDLYQNPPLSMVRLAHPWKGIFQSVPFSSVNENGKAPHANPEEAPPFSRIYENDLFLCGSTHEALFLLCHGPHLLSPRESRGGLSLTQWKKDTVPKPRGGSPPSARLGCLVQLREDLTQVHIVHEGTLGYGLECLTRA